MDNGPSSKAAIELGRKLAAACEDHDVTGQWMAHHLAALVSAADAADGVTVEQRVEIIETILKVWGARRKFPGQVPGYELDQVFIALDMLGDDRPWRFSRLQSYAAGLDAAKDAGPPLAATAVTLERLTRQTVLALVWRACQDAASRNEEWLVAAAAAMAPLKEELSANTRSVHRRLWDLVGDEAFDGVDDEEKTEISTSNLALRLRTMADQLHSLADELDDNTSPSP